MSTFSGDVYDAALPHGRSGCTLTLRPPWLLAELPSGTSLRLDLRRAVVEVEGTGESASFRFVAVTRDGPAFVTADPALHQAVRRAAIPGFGREAGREDALRHRRRTRRLIVGGALGLLALTAAPFLAVGPLAPLVVRAVPKSVDRELAEAAEKEVEEFALGEQIDDPQLVKPVLAVVARLEPAARGLAFPLRVSLRRTQMINAFALPGGHVFVTTGILDFCESPAELAGVIAHEIVHVAHRHAVEHMVRAAGISVVMLGLFGSGQSVSRVLVEQAALLGTLSYSRANETDADLEGTHLLARAGLPTGGLVHFLRRLEALEQAAGLASPLFLRTHPLTRSRVHDLDKLIDKLGGGAPELAVDGWQEMKNSLLKPPPRTSRNPYWRPGY